MTNKASTPEDWTGGSGDFWEPLWLGGSQLLGPREVGGQPAWQH